ncbi:cold-shock protein, partial [Tenacibaculum finnmarkense]
MNRGTVKFFNESKGFGFITEEGSNKEHFVHVSG